MNAQTIHPKNAVIQRKYFLQVLFFIIPKLSRFQGLIYGTGLQEKSPLGIDHILTRNITSG